MKGSELTPHQLRKLRDALRPKLQYLAAVKNRMSQRQFADNDRMYRDVQIAEVALRDLIHEIETLLSFHRPGSSRN